MPDRLAVVTITWLFLGKFLGRMVSPSFLLLFYPSRFRELSRFEPKHHDGWGSERLSSIIFFSLFLFSLSFPTVYYHISSDRYHLIILFLSPHLDVHLLARAVLGFVCVLFSCLATYGGSVCLNVCEFSLFRCPFTDCTAWIPPCIVTLLCRGEHNTLSFAVGNKKWKFNAMYFTSLRNLLQHKRTLRSLLPRASGASLAGALSMFTLFLNGIMSCHRKNQLNLVLAALLEIDSSWAPFLLACLVYELGLLGLLYLPV